MSIKKRLGLGVASAALGMALIGGGTYAYFSDQEVTNNAFAAGTLDLSANPTALIDIDGLKLGDTMLREFVLTNDGSLKIENVNLETNYAVTDLNGDNSVDFGKHLNLS